MPNNHSEPGKPFRVWPEGPFRMHLNTNTYVSFGLMVVLIGGFGWVIKGQSDSKAETLATRNELLLQAQTTKSELSGQIGALQNRLGNLESAKNSWTAVDMFKWAVHLQQSNSDGKKLQTEGLKVPEPEVTK